jgi:hypothetical protein
MFTAMPVPIRDAVSDEVIGSAYSVDFARRLAPALASARGRSVYLDHSANVRRLVDIREPASRPMAATA